MGWPTTAQEWVNGLAEGFDEVAINRESIPQGRLNLAARTRTSVLPWRGQFSPELVDVLLDTYAREGDTVLDPFVGSGTTLIECGRRGHTGYGVDVNAAAIYSARTAEFINLAPAQRRTVLHEVERYLLAELGALRTPDLFTPVTDIGAPTFDATQRLLSLFAARLPERYARTVLANVVMRAMDDADDQATADKVFRAYGDYRAVCERLPYSSFGLHAREADARRLPLPCAAVDLILTSPPYINVFNYHQNYRKAMELLGFEPLAAARSEIGANRKHRQNRFLTVVQYCLDMLEVLQEARRVLRPKGRAIIVVGRESNVLGQAFENARAVYSLAVAGAGFRLLQRHERVFVSRYGPRVYEDILVLQASPVVECRSATFARQVARYLLEHALEHAPSDVQPSIGAALQSVSTVPASPLLQLNAAETRDIAQADWHQEPAMNAALASCAVPPHSPGQVRFHETQELFRDHTD